MIRALATGAAVFVMAALFVMNLKQAVLLAACTAAVALAVGRFGR